MKTKSERLNLLIPNRTRKLLEQLKERIGAASLTEIIRCALNVLDIISEAVLSGKQVIIRNPSSVDSTKGEVEIKIIL